MGFHRVTEFVALLSEARYERSLLGLRARFAKLDQLVLNLWSWDGMPPGAPTTGRALAERGGAPLFHRLGRRGLRGRVKSHGVSESLEALEEATGFGLGVTT